jgi:hypothetical protein
VELDDVVTVDTPPDTLERLPGQDPNFPRGSINTDPKHRLLESDSAAMDGSRISAVVAFLNQYNLKETLTDGYAVLDLRGVWATAPYLHNGSVPTLEALLQPAALRPKTFQTAGATFDTTQPGDSNQGHEFGTTLSDSDKAALLAYLRSL